MCTPDGPSIVPTLLTGSSCCVFATYALWWSKPYSPNEPIVLQGPRLEELSAFLYMSSEVSGNVDKASIQSSTRVKTFFTWLNVYSKRPELERLVFVDSTGDLCETKPCTELNPIPPSAQQFSPAEKPQRYFFCPVPKKIQGRVSEYDRKADSGTAFFERRPRVLDERDGEDHQPSTRTERRWQLAAAAVARFPALMEGAKVLTVDGEQYLRIPSRELVVTRVSNWPAGDLLRDVNGLVVGIVLWLASLAYGALHAAAWNDVFPTDVEMWFWRASSCYIAFCGLLWVALNSISQMHKPLNDFWEGWMDGLSTWAHYAVLGTPVAICGFSFFVARAYIVVEAFISVRSLPPEAYVTPSWTQLFPHF